MKKLSPSDAIWENWTKRLDDSVGRRFAPADAIHHLRAELPRLRRQRNQKPEAIIAPLLEYAVPPGGSVIDIFAGSGTTLIEARRQGMTAVGIEKRLCQCREIIRRLAQTELNLSHNPKP